jgi:BirA family transcriptional regulator, biotin operon repressor / biotin---[acetyl-CoA-carboxylase] ligase
VSARAEPTGDTRPPTLGTPRVHRKRTRSTNELARELATAGAPHGTLVTASEQTAGRGRHGREWWAPPGDSLLMSLVLREPSSLLPLASAVAVVDAVSETSGIEPLIKWPNDVVLERTEEGTASRATTAALSLAKLAGILIEARPPEQWVVLGIGVNVAVSPEAIPPELRGIVASLCEARSAVESLLDSLLRALERRLREPEGETLDSWRARDALRGREIAWRTGEDVGEESRGRAEGIDGAGRLVVARADGSRLTLEAGDVHLAGGLGTP